MSKSFKRVLALLAAIFIIAFAGAAFADDASGTGEGQTESEIEYPISLALESWHHSEVPLLNGVPNYTGASFKRVVARPVRRRVTLTQEVHDLTGTLTITGGEFYSGHDTYEAYPQHNGTSHSSGDGFNLINRNKVGRNRVRFDPVENDDEGNASVIIFAWTESNEGMNGYNVSWTFSDKTLIEDGSGTIPNYTSTADQLASGVVPYVELIMNGSTVTGFRWRFVNPSNTSAAVSAPADLAGVAMEIWAERDGEEIGGYIEEEILGEDHSNTTVTRYQNDDGEFQDISFSLDELKEIVFIKNMADGLNYIWNFKPMTPAQQFMFRSKVRSYLSNGQSTYDNASFRDVGFVIDDDSELYQYRGGFATDAEVEATGTLTITNAQSYSYGTSSSNTTSVAANASQQFILYNEHEAMPEKNYRASNSSGAQINFYGEAESAFKGAVLTASFASMPEMSGSATVPSNFYTMSEQMNYAVPYIELVTSGTNVTGVRWRVVRASNPNTALTLNQVSDFKRIRVEPFNDNGRMSTRTHRVNRSDLSDGAVLEGEIAFDAAYALSEVKYFRTFIDTFANDDTDNFNRFVWNFYQETSAQQQEAVSDAATGVPEASTVSSSDAANTLGVNPSDIKTLDNSDNAEVGEERAPEDVSESDAAELTENNRRAVLILPVIAIKSDGIYLFKIKVDVSLIGQRLFFNAFKQTGANSPNAGILKSTSAAADDNENDITHEGGYVFFDDDGKQINEVPENGEVNVAVKLKAGSTYAPIASVASENDNDDDDDNATSSHSSSSNCSLGFGGLAALLALGFIASKRRF